MPDLPPPGFVNFKRGKFDSAPLIPPAVRIDMLARKEHIYTYRRSSWAFGSAGLAKAIRCRFRCRAGEIGLVLARLRPQQYRVLHDQWI